MAAFRRPGRRRRRVSQPIIPKPSNIVAQVAGSGAVLTTALTIVTLSNSNPPPPF